MELEDLCTGVPAQSSVLMDIKIGVWCLAAAFSHILRSTSCSLPIPLCSTHHDVLCQLCLISVFNTAYRFHHISGRRCEHSGTEGYIL